MPNIEIKAKFDDHKSVVKVALEMNALYQGRLHQIDTYYNTMKGRLKLREINNKEAYLIPYYKNYSLGPMKSNYELLKVHDPENLKNILAHLHGELCVIDKLRDVYLLGNVRIHLDKVEGLGQFIELEAVYKDDSEQVSEVKKVNDLMQKLNIKKEDLVEKSYIDYLL